MWWSWAIRRTPEVMGKASHSFGRPSAMSPPTTRTSTPQKERNRQISRVRVRIEHVFARLKCWRVIAGIFPTIWSKLGVVVKALAVLHNLAREI
nr:transposase family protein [Cupriavidus yeoncheonensis]